MPLVRSHDTVIIGGGIAGLACARRLHDGGRSFLLITENIGGRIRRSTDGAANLGAYYVRGDYHHVNRFVDRGRQIKRRRILRGVGDGLFTQSDLPLLRYLPQTVRFVRFMREFRNHYEHFKQDCLRMSQAQAIRSNPLLWDLYREPAPRMIQRLRIEDLARLYLAPAVHGTAFTSVDRVTAFTLLVGVLPTVIPMFEYTFRFDLITAGLEKALLFDSVTEVTTTGGRYSIQTRTSGILAADHVVVATPIDVSARLLELGPVKRPISAHTFIVKGNLRHPLDRAPFTLFPEGDPTFGIARQSGGSILFCSDSDDPDFDKHFTSWEVVEHHHWNPAFQLEGDALLECEQGPGLFVIGDHNVCDLEDAYITGVYAANRILADPNPASQS